LVGIFFGGAIGSIGVGAMGAAPPQELQVLQQLSVFHQARIRSRKRGPPQQESQAGAAQVFTGTQVEQAGWQQSFRWNNFGQWNSKVRQVGWQQVVGAGAQQTGAGLQTGAGVQQTGAGLQTGAGVQQTGAGVHLGAQVGAQVSQQSRANRPRRWARRRCPNGSQPHGSTQPPQEPPHAAVAAGGAGGAVGGGGGTWPVLSQAVVINRKATFTRLPPYGVD
jgi:hypothetical protein